MNASFTYSTSKFVTSTWSVGFDLGIDSSDLAKASGNAGFSFSYSQGTTTGSTEGISQICGPLTGAQGLFSCGSKYCAFNSPVTDSANVSSISERHRTDADTDSSGNSARLLSHHGYLCNRCQLNVQHRGPIRHSAAPDRRQRPRRLVP